MIGIHHYWVFVISGLLLNLTPGQDTLYVIGSSLAGGRKAGVASALGINAGSLVHTAFAAAGLSAILATSGAAFTIVKCIGAAYLFFLGIKLLRSREDLQFASNEAEASRWKAFRRGMVTNLLNPKVALFFLAFLPQFIEPDISNKFVPFMILGCTFVASGTLWCLTLAISAAAFRSFFCSYPDAKIILDRCVGFIFLMLGIRLATSSVQ